jgi:hypothetical protein
VTHEPWTSRSLVWRRGIREVDPSGSIHLDVAMMHKTSHRSLVASNPRRARMAFVTAASYAVNLRHVLKLKEAQQGFATNLFFEVRRLR